MPSKKHRRRREKARRHEYEYVYVDDEGNEVEVDPSELKAERAPSRNGRARSTPRQNLRIQPPSWRRVGKRGLIFAPVMFIVVMLLNPDFNLFQVALNTLLLLLIFLPFSYFMDTFMYRRYAKRAGIDPDAGR